MTYAIAVAGDMHYHTMDIASLTAAKARATRELTPEVNRPLYVTNTDTGQVIAIKYSGDKAWTSP